jgi:hypothetical protein
VIQKVAIDLDLDAIDGKWCDAQPVGIGMVGRLAGSTFA